MTSETEARSRWTRRQLLQAGLVGTGVVALGGVGHRLYVGPSRAWDPAGLGRPVFGVLQAGTGMYDELRALGIDAVTVSLTWSSAEPAGPGLDEAYLREVEGQYRAARAAGLEVALGTGLQYPPGWVTDLPDAAFVNQLGRQHSGGPGDGAADAVFNTRVRAAQDAYLRRLAERLDDLVPAGIRVGGLTRGELHYPPAGQGEPENTFWAFGAAATASSPVPTFRPGVGPPEEAALFVDWYLGSLAEYGRWQLEAYRRYFGPDPRLIVLLPSWGIRPGEIEAAVAGRLSGESLGERRDALTQGLDWERQLPLFAQVDSVDVCTTWLDPLDQGMDDSLISPGVYLASLARRHGLGLWGENTGDNDVDEMRRCLERVRELGLEGLFWMGGDDQNSAGTASVEDYSRLISARDWRPPPGTPY